MKKRFAKKAVALLMVTSMLVIDSVGISVDKGITNVSDNIINANETVSNDKKKDDTSKGTKLESADDALKYDEEVDYEAIIEDAKDETYREEVVISENSFLVMREESEDTTPIEEEDWYKENITDYKVVAEVTEDGVKKVTYSLTTEEKDVWEIVDAANESDSTVIAEPEYIFYIAAEDDLQVSDNPGIGSQWYLKDFGMTSLWKESEGNNTTGEGVVVAVIDTGVDYTHEDLKDNMWMNTAELSGVEGVDDDGNGHIDDIYGVSFIDNGSDPMDDNGHGTHVAGIIAMDNNDKGGVGVAYNAQIMAIKAGGADGTLSSSDIARAINYATSNGADVINMSFGSYARSAIVEEALAKAFSTCVLVAAAGNDAWPTADAIGYVFKGNMYPAAYSYVVGVMAHDSLGNLSNFSNWDYKMNYGAEYEVVAPGSSIYSTLPGNRYASWSGTSMATPMVSAAAAILRSKYTDKNEYSSRYIMGQLVSATEDTVYYKEFYGEEYYYSKLNIEHSLTKYPKPNINVEEVYIFDSPSISDKNNGDGIVQPGETIDIAVGYRNQWGAATEFYATVSTTSAGGVDNPYVTFITGKEVLLEDIGTFGTQNNEYIYDEYNTIVGVRNPIRVKISENAPNDANIAFYINYRAKNALDSKDTNVYRQYRDAVYTVSVQKGKVLKGKITENMTLTNDEYYIIENSLLVPRGVTVNVEAGTKLQFWSADSSTVYGDTNMAYIQVEGVMNFNGTEEAPIELFPGKDYEAFEVAVVANPSSNASEVNMSYCNIINPNIMITTGDHLNLVQDPDAILSRRYDDNGEIYLASVESNIYAEKITNSKIKNLRYLWNRANICGTFDTVLFDNCAISTRNWSEIVLGDVHFSTNGRSEFVNCTFLENQARVENWDGTLTYITSSLTSVGESFVMPQYETSDIYVLNNKKYIIYRFDGYWYSDSSYKNYMNILRMVRENGGTLATPDVYNEAEMAMFIDLKNDLCDENNNYLEAYTGVYYDNETGKTVCLTTSDGSLPEGYYELSKNTIATVYSSSDDSAWRSSTTWHCNYAIAEYPMTVSDYNVLNPVVTMGTVEEDIAKSEAFKNNAILNRLTETETSNWMKIKGENGNRYTYFAQNNYWGTTDPKLIQKQLIDFDTNIGFADYVIDPYLTTVAESAYPCVTGIYVLDKDGNKTTSVSNGEIEVHVLFNRDMDTSVLPTVTYGPDDPYTDYLINGSFISPREWVGTVEIKVLINQGQQYFKVIGGVAADDAWLTTGSDWARFGFKVEATGAEALTLQGEGLQGEVHLMWTQDDYETLAGYNVYRSATGAEGTYEKVNSSIVAAADKEFSDKTVSAGTTYYYYFTVVDTALVESIPSNVITCASIDDVVPVVRHKTQSSYTYGINANIVATITDNVGVSSATLYFRMKGESTYKQIQMICTSANSYSVQIPAKELKVGELEYYIEAADSVSFGYGASATEPYVVEVKSDAVILSVQCDDGVTGKEMTAVVNGINFTEGVDVYIDGAKVESTVVSDKEIDIVYTPEYMGKKTVELRKDGNVLSKLSGAITVKDDTVKIFNKECIIITGKDGWQYIDLYSSYVGKVDSVEITYSYNGGSVWFYPTMSYYNGKDSEVYENNVCIRTRRFDVDGEAFGGKIGQIEIYDPDGQEYINVISMKINGIEVKNLQYDETLITYISQDEYIPIEDIEFDETDITVEVGETFSIGYTIYPVNATLKDYVQPTIDNYNGAIVDNGDGTYTATKCGDMNIWISTENGSKYVRVHVNPLPVTDIVLDSYIYNGVAGETIEINVTANPIESDAWLSWWCSWDSFDIFNYDTYDNGRTAKVKLLGEGTAYLEVSYGDICKTITINVLSNEAYVEVSEEMLVFIPNQIKQLTYAIKNADATANLNVKWSSSNTAVAKVDANGKVTAVGKGMAVISAVVDGTDTVDSVVVLVGSDSMSYTKGDVNMDGKITATDAMLALKLISCAECNDNIRKLADVNGNGTITSSDAMLILQYATGKIKQF